MKYTLAFIVAFLSILVPALGDAAQVYKCVDPRTKAVTYSSTACVAGDESKINTVDNGTELLTAAIGAISALAGVVVGYWFQLRVAKKARIVDSVFRAMAHARQYQHDVLEFGIAFLRIGDLPKPLPEDDPIIARQFGLEYGLKRFAAAQQRLLEAERELRLVGVELALFTNLHRTPGDTVSYYDIIVDEMCGHLGPEIVSEAQSEEAVLDTVFRYGVILAHFEQEAVEFLRRNVDRDVRVPESVSIGAPQDERSSEAAITSPS